MYKISAEDAHKASLLFVTDKVAAIKWVRASTGTPSAGLKDSKDFVENRCKSNGVIEVFDRTAIDIVKEMLGLAEKMAELKIEMNNL